MVIVSNFRSRAIESRVGERMDWNSHTIPAVIIESGLTDARVGTVGGRDLVEPDVFSGQRTRR